MTEQKVPQSNQRPPTTEYVRKSKEPVAQQKK